MRHYFHCIKCGKIYRDLGQVCSHDNYHNFLEITYDYADVKKLDKARKKAALKKMLPLKKAKPVSLGEGGTPLVRLHNYSDICVKNKIYTKDEGQNPAGSFKDRETSIAIAQAKESGFKKITIASSGNAALSAAFYASQLGIKCKCYIPKKISKEKKFFLKKLKADFCAIEGDYEKIYKMIADNPSEGELNISAGKNLFREEGSKKIAWEIWEKIGVPEIIIVPIGNGTLISAIYKGFFELEAVGLTKKMPQLIGVQVKNSSPVGLAIKQKKDFAVLSKAPDSIAEGIVARESYDSPKAVRAIKASKGYVVEVTEEEIIDILKKINKIECLDPEPTAAVVYAALDKLILKEKKGQKIVCIQTGRRIKNLPSIV